MNQFIKDMDYYQFIDEKHIEFIEHLDSQDHLMSIIEYKEAISTLTRLRDEYIVKSKYSQALIYQAQLKHLNHKLCNHINCLDEINYNQTSS
ncbi:MAG: hypothetical protein ABJO02_13115 [Reichenbachiella sp.]|uniref:hypothetical protein n=1 Tax=Reichenbachiella sp. TaxID=2184521 RepID=UPI003297B775